MCRRARPPCHTSEPAGVDRARVPTSFEERLSSEIAGEYVALAAHRCDPDVRVGDHAFKQVAVRVFGIERAEHHVVEPLPRRADVLLRHMVGARPGLVAAQQLVQGHVEILRPPDCPVPCGEPRQLIRILRVRMLRVGDHIPAGVERDHAMRPRVGGVGHPVLRPCRLTGARQSAQN